MIVYKRVQCFLEKSLHACSRASSASDTLEGSGDDDSDGDGDGIVPMGSFIFSTKQYNE